MTDTLKLSGNMREIEIDVSGCEIPKDCTPDLLAMLERVTGELAATYEACAHGLPVISIGQFGRLAEARQLIATIKGEV